MTFAQGDPGARGPGARALRLGRGTGRPGRRRPSARASAWSPWPRRTSRRRRSVRGDRPLCEESGPGAAGSGRSPTCGWPPSGCCAADPASARCTRTGARRRPGRGGPARDLHRPLHRRQVALTVGRPRRARSQLHEGIRLSVDTGDMANLAYFLDALGVVEARGADRAGSPCSTEPPGDSGRPSAPTSTATTSRTRRCSRQSLDAAREALGGDSPQRWPQGAGSTWPRSSRSPRVGQQPLARSPQGDAGGPQGPPTSALSRHLPGTRTTGDR